jgi:succinoglycan biosynthesis protein ExoA
MRPFVSIIIPCRNEAASLDRCLSSILASDYPPERLEILVADGMSTDGSRALLAAHAPRLRMIDNPARITPMALNLAIEGAQGDYILRVDAHSTIEPAYISTLIDFLERHIEAWGAGGGMTTEPESSGLFAQAIVTVLSHRFGVGNSRFRTGVGEAQPADTAFNCCWRREVFQRVGLFHEQLARSQDIEMSSRIARAGGTLWLVPQAATTYFARTNFLRYLRHNWSNGVWSILPALYLGHLPVSWRHLVPLAFVTALAASLPLGLAPWIALPYALANLAASAHAAAQLRRPSLLALLPITFAGLHLAYGAGSLWGAVRLLLGYFRNTPTPIRTLSTT